MFLPPRRTPDLPGLDNLKCFSGACFRENDTVRIADHNSFISFLKIIVIPILRVFKNSTF